MIGAIGDDFDTATDQGSAYHFRRVGIAWGEQGKRVAPDGAAGDSFGTSVALGSNYSIVGASSDDEVGTSNAGSVYLDVVGGFRNGFE